MSQVRGNFRTAGQSASAAPRGSRGRRRGAALALCPAVWKLPRREPFGVRRKEPL